MLPRPPPGPLASLPVLHLLLVLPEDNQQSGSQTRPPATRSHKASNIPTLQPSPAFVSFTAKIYPVNGRIQGGSPDPLLCSTGR